MRKQNNNNLNLLGDDFYYRKSRKQVWKEMSGEEKKLLKDIMNARTQTIHLRTEVMVNVLLHNQKIMTFSEKKLENYKNTSFEDCKSNIMYYAMTYKAEHETSLSVMDLYSSGYMALEGAWNRFLMKTQEEIENDKKNKKMVFASFKTFSDSYIKNAMAIEIMKDKSIERGVFNVPKTAKYHTSNVAKAIHSFVCATGKLPTPEELAESLNISVKTVKNSLSLLKIGEFSGNEEQTVDIEEIDAEIIRDFDFSSCVCEDLNPFKKTMMEKCKSEFWTEVEKLVGQRKFYCLTRYFFDGVTYAVIADEIGVTSERVRQLINETMEEIKSSKDLLEILIESVK